MFKNISWHSFITGAVVTVIIYYIIIGAMYFRGDVVRLFKEGFKRKAKPEPFSADSTSTKDPALFSTVHELMAELKDLFFAAAKEDYPKEELLQALHIKLKAYTHLKGTNFEQAIHTHIIQSGSDICNIHLNETDLKRIW